MTCNSKHDINLIKSHLLSIFINGRDIEPVIIKKANKYMSSKFGDFQFWDLMTFLGEAIGLDSLLETYKTSEKNLTP